MKVRRVKDFYTLHPDLYEKFLKHIEDNNLNKSKLIETLIEEYMGKVKEIKN
jgi:hypothetical protein